MITTWDAIEDDNLNFAEKTVTFLQSEFCPSGVDPIWSVDYFKWKLSNINPAGSGYLSVALCNNRVIGTVSLTRKRILINGIEYMGGEVGDSYSSNLFRCRTTCSSLSSYDSNPDSYINKSIFGRLASDVRARAEASGVSIIYGTPNKNAYPGWTKRLEYFDLITYDNQNYLRPTVHFIARKLPMKMLFCAAMYATEKVWLNFSKILNTSISDRNKKHTIEMGPPSDQEIDFLWDEVRPTIGFSLVRDSKYWVHRYKQYPLGIYSFFRVYDKERLVAFVVTRKATTNTGKKIVYIVEWMINESDLFEYIVYHIIDIYRKDEIDAFSFYASGSLFKGRYSIKYGFVKRNRVPIIFANTEEAQLLKKLNNDFHFYIGNTDAI
jgi:hypothetical protein